MQVFVWSVCFWKHVKLSFAFILPGIVMMLLFASCTSAFTNASPPLSGHIKIDGSTALLPLVSKAASLFEHQYPQVHISVQGGGSLTGLNDVTSQKVNIGDSDIYADPASYPDPDLTDHLVCVIPFTMIASSDVPVNSLTTADIIGIFATGTIKNWSQVGGPDLPIVPIVRTATSGTRATFRRYVLGGRDELGSLMTIDSSQDVVKKVAATPGAIGYLAASVLNAHVHTLALDGWSATLENIAAGHYPFWSYEHMYTLNVAANSPTVAFLNFMFSSQVQQQVAALHYIPTSRLHFAPLSSISAVKTAGDSYLIEERGRPYESPQATPIQF